MIAMVEMATKTTGRAKMNTPRTARMGRRASGGEAARGWIRNSNVLMKAAARATQELNTCEQHQYPMLG